MTREMIDNYIIPSNNAADRRENPRLGVHVRVSVLGVDDKTTLHNEKTETIDVSATGVRLTIGYPVRVGNHLSITVNDPNLKAKMASFRVRWVQPYGGRFLVGAELESTPEKWMVAGA